MANNLFTLDEMDPDRDVKKLRHVVRLHKSFKSQKNGDINRSRSVLWWGRKGINNRIWKDTCPFKNGYAIYYWLQILEPFFRFLIDLFFYSVWVNPWRPVHFFGKSVFFHFLSLEYAGMIWKTFLVTRSGNSSCLESRRLGRFLGTCLCIG